MVSFVDETIAELCASRAPVALSSSTTFASNNLSSSRMVASVVVRDPRHGVDAMVLILI